MKNIAAEYKIEAEMNEFQQIGRTLKPIRTEERIIKNSPHSIDNCVSMSDCDNFIL